VRDNSPEGGRGPGRPRKRWNDYLSFSLHKEAANPIIREKRTKKKKKEIFKLKADF
jgi:hypothetical protein